MKRRDFITLISGAVASSVSAANAQQSQHVRRVGILMPYAKGDAENEARVQSLKQKLADLGWVEGRNIQFDERWTMDYELKPRV